MKGAIVLVAPFVALACAHPAPPSVTPRPAAEYEEHLHSYPVNPLDAAGLAQSIADERKRFASNAIGQTSMALRWTYTATPAGGGQCTLTAVHVVVSTTVSIPQWNVPPGTSLARRQWWQRILAAVSLHEHHHVVIEEEGGEAIAEALQELKAVDCRVLEGLAEAAGRAEVTRTHERQREFDNAEGTITIPAPPP